MSRRGIDARTDRMARRHLLAGYNADVRRLAAHLGIAEAELRAEIAEVERLCEAAGAFTVDARVAVVAQDLGIPVEELWAGIRELREAVRAAA